MNDGKANDNRETLDESRRAADAAAAARERARERAADDGLPRKSGAPKQGGGS
jgi:hypothetical protein